MLLLIRHVGPEWVSQQKNSDIDEIGRRDINKHQINFISLEKEIALGKQLAAEIERAVKLLHDPVITEYVSRLGQRSGPKF
jgi:predicted Zn-dependent protease